MFDQEQASQNVADLSGNGCNQSALTFTSVSVFCAPIGYGMPLPIKPRPGISPPDAQPPPRLRGPTRALLVR